jgi:hypothetical protein
MTHLRPKNTPPMQHFETALAKNLGRRIPKQPFRRSVPRNDLALIAHAKGGIGGPLKEGKQLTLEHSKNPQMHTGVDHYAGSIEYERSIEKIELLQVYDQTWAASQHAAAVKTVSIGDLRLYFSRKQEKSPINQIKTYRGLQSGNVIAWNAELRRALSPSGHPNLEVDTSAYSNRLLTCDVRKDV